MSNKLKYNVQILVDGKSVKEYNKDGKVFIEAKSGTEYSIRVKNNTGKRALAIISVDGINAITGNIATPQDSGYVINSWSSIEIKGYRKDTEGGGRFKFTEKGSGYSNEVDGTGVNSGVIGVVIIEEKEIPVIPVYYKMYDFDKYPTPETAKPYVTFGGYDLGNSSILRSCADNSVKCSDAYPFSSENVKNTVKPEFDSATTWGSAYKQEISYTDFQRSNNIEIQNIYYASQDALKAMGVIIETPPAISFPQSFQGFAKPPQNWSA